MRVRRGIAVQSCLWEGLNEFALLRELDVAAKNARKVQTPNQGSGGGFERRRIGNDAGRTGSAGLLRTALGVGATLLKWLYIHLGTLNSGKKDRRPARGNWRTC